MSNDLTPERAAELFELGPERASLIWRCRPVTDFASPWAHHVWNKRFAGTTAGTVGAHGYVVVGIRGKKHKVHRIIHAMCGGGAPPEVDHADNDRLNNSPGNLRPADDSEQNMNRLLCRRNKSGRKGVSWHKKAGKWQAHVTAGGKKMYLGLYATVDAASAARNAAAKLAHGAYFNDGSGGGAA